MMNNASYAVVNEESCNPETNEDAHEGDPVHQSLFDFDFAHPWLVDVFAVQQA